ncbi:MFS transporter [Streptomyces albulus]|nr:MFS transporter [Streptomyces noursei]
MGAVLAGSLYGLAYGAMLSVWNVVIAGSTEGRTRSAAFGLQFVALNAGVGLGGVLGGLFASTADPGRFQWLYVTDGLSFLLAGALLVAAVGRPRTAAPTGPVPGRTADVARRGYAAVLRDRQLLKVLALTLALMVVGYGQLESSIPGLVAVQGLDARVMAWAFVANTCCIVLIQALAVTRISRTGPAALLAATATSWAGCWLLLLLAMTSGRPALEAALVVGALAVFAVGEALLAVALPTLVNGLAPKRCAAGTTAPTRLRCPRAWCSARCWADGCWPAPTPGCCRSSWDWAAWRASRRAATGPAGVDGARGARATPDARTEETPGAPDRLEHMEGGGCDDGPTGQRTRRGHDPRGVPATRRRTTGRPRAHPPGHHRQLPDAGPGLGRLRGRTRPRRRGPR